MDPKIELIRDKAQLDGTAYFEFLPGRYSDKHWNDTSVYIDEEVFCMIERPFQESLPRFDHFAFSDVSAKEWQAVLIQLARFRDRIASASSPREVTELFMCLWDETRQVFSQEFNQNRNDLVRLIDDLRAWIADNLSREQTIAILGM
jgi:hypothetical protein